MPVISLFSGVFCGEKEVIRQVVAAAEFKLVTDRDIAARAETLSGIPEAKIRRAFSAKTSVFNKFTHEKECSIAFLKLALAEMLAERNLLISGFSGLLIPESINHVLRVCLIAELSHRTKRASQEHGIPEKEALKAIRRDDADRAAWTDALFSEKDPWSDAPHDIVIPMNRTDAHQAYTLIQNNLLKDVIRRTADSEKAIEDFQLAARTGATLSEAGHNVAVNAKNGEVALTIDKHVLMLGRLEEELTSIAKRVPGVSTVETRVGKGFHRSNIYRKHNFEVPSRVLLVDDEREFVQTLSERLEMRDMGSAVVYDGQSALDFVESDEPEVIIIDLKMPGVNGMEVLKRVKETRPEIEVIVLTGHGDEKDRLRCMELGAFAYMQKPVDFNKLSDTLKRAYEKTQKKSEL